MTISGPKAHSWRPAAVIRAKGTDAYSFLQGQFTNDLKDVANGAVVYGLWLNLKGKVHSDGFISKGEVPDEFWIISYFSPGAEIRERLESYIIADDVSLADESADFHGMTVAGDGAAGRAKSLGAPIVFPGRRGIEGSVECLARAPFAEDRATALSAADMELARIRAGIPSVPADIGPGELPNEGGLERDGISYTKGCYLGQEVMARLKNLGKVRRRLCRVSGNGPPPARGSKLFEEERAVGEMRTAVADGGGFAGMALVTLLQLKGDAGLSSEPGGPAAIKLLDSP